MHEYTKGDDMNGETGFMPIYKLNIETITLRELLLFQSIYVSRTETDIFNII